ncbi:hypothetical protein RUE5091_00266 [Ruegeria denitrificans]|uniref:Uncharacterized protein n=1 Tax=Ruegeria denitrificans TaxID=1715692 RepID=A0A0P1IAJ0_9RHOB|nr:hypothetical protein RUE5091_00266 [Ruegeria denitrificans]
MGIKRGIDKVVAAVVTEVKSMSPPLVTQPGSQKSAQSLPMVRLQLVGRLLMRCGNADLQV